KIWKAHENADFQVFFALRIVMVEWRFWASVMGLMRRSVRQLAGLSRLKAVSTD
ncbi:hypothetical protein PSYAR_00100, partial [Pseudomonas syringae pv. aceris str. M302273]